MKVKKYMRWYLQKLSNCESGRHVVVGGGGDVVVVVGVVVVMVLMET